MTHADGNLPRSLITGGTGTLGYALTKAFLAEGFSVAILSRDPHKQTLYRQQFPQVELFLGDVRDPEVVARAVKGRDIVVHAAALKQVDVGQVQSLEFKSVNVDGALNVARQCQLAGVRKSLFISSDKACLDYHTGIRTKSGEIVLLGKLVNDKMDVEVETMTENGVEYRRVIGWFKNRRSDRKLFKISYRHGYSNGAGLRCPNGGAVIGTEDHEVLTNHGWKAISQVESSDLLVTNEICPNDAQMSFILGTLMGDAFIGGRGEGKRKNGRGHIKFLQSMKQEEWLRIKWQIMRRFAISEPKLTSRMDKKYKTSRHAIEFSTHSMAWIGELDTVMYPDGKKVIPRDLITKYFNSIMMATWFMDDGCITGRNMRLATHGFSKEDVEWLVEFFNEQGLECYLYECKVFGKSYPELRFTVRGSNNLINFISKHFPESMRYKLGDMGHAYVPESWSLGEPQPYFGVPVIEELQDSFEPANETITLPPQNKGVTKCKRGHDLSGDNVYIIPQTGSRQCLQCRALMSKRRNGTNHHLFVRDVYCIEVEETHNFIATGMVFHNCQPVNLYGHTKAIAEYLWLNSTTSTTLFSAVRYGNVMGSNGSVIPIWQQQIARGLPIMVRTPDTTRFFMLKSQAVDLVQQALREMQGGETFIPGDIPAFSLHDLAEQFEPDYSKWLLLPLGAGEKVHEVLVAPGECVEMVLPKLYRIVHNKAGKFEVADEFKSQTARRIAAQELLAQLEN